MNPEALVLPNLDDTKDKPNRQVTAILVSTSFSKFLFYVHLLIKSNQMLYISYEESSGQKKMSQVINTTWKGSKSSTSPENHLGSISVDVEPERYESGAEEVVPKRGLEETVNITREASNVAAMPGTDIRYTLPVKSLGSSANTIFIKQP